MWRVAIVKSDGTTTGMNFKTKEECEDWVLKQADNGGVKKAIICNKDNIKTKEIINF